MSLQEEFIEYYTPDDQEYRNIIENGIIAIDANVLLAPYRLDEASRTETIQLLREFANQIWIPYQAAWEYFENRLEVIAGQEKIYQQLDSALKRTRKDIEEQLKPLVNHPIISHTERSAILGGIDELVERVRTLSSRREMKLEEALRDDPILRTWESLFEGKVGPRPDERQFHEVFQEAKARLSAMKPPGYADSEKSENSTGDAVLWLQLIEHAKKEKRPVLLVTSDVKGDWYRRYAGHTAGPRIELVKEMREIAGASYYQQTLSAFLRRAGRIAGNAVSKSTVSQVESAAAVESGTNYERMVYDVLLAAFQDYRRSQITEGLREIKYDPLSPVSIQILTIYGSVLVDTRYYEGSVDAQAINLILEFARRFDFRAVLVVSPHGLTRQAASIMAKVSNVGGVVARHVKWADPGDSIDLLNIFAKILDDISVRG